MSRVFWDTNVFVYLMEDHPEYGEKVEEIRRRMILRRDRLCTSALTLGETLVAPFRGGDRELDAAYRKALQSSVVEIIDFDSKAGEQYARIRAALSVSRTDALQLACAARAEVDLFLTNDRRLTRLHVPGIQFISGLDHCPL